MPDLGKIAYEAWCRFVVARHTADNFLFMPWEELRSCDQDAWAATEQAVRDVSPWIPVGERMPEDNSHVMVLDLQEVVSIAEVSERKFYNRDNGGIVFDVTHWMPMPEAPQ